MYRWTVALLAILLTLIFTISCSGGGTGTPVIPGTDTSITASTVDDTSATNTLWGYYDIYFNFETGEVEAVANRSVAFNANVVDFVNSNPANLAFNILETPVGPDYVDVDIDVTITHPLAGLPQYDGYDVRGVFIANGSSSFSHDASQKYGAHGTDATMLNDPDDEQGGGPDGYTRWYNPKEFTIPGLFGYTPGAFATAGFSGTATVNPYRLFGDGLGAQDDAWDWNMTGGDNMVFSSGSSNTRNYYLRFPLAGGVEYNYAIVASWEGEDPGDHPANTVEAMVISTTITDNIYYVDPGDNGGDLILDISVGGYYGQPSTIIIESNVLATHHTFDPGVIVSGGDPTYSTYSLEIPSDAVLTTTGNEYWVVLQYPDESYGNDFGVPNTADGDPLSAYFRYPLYTATEPYNQDPICDVQAVTVFPIEGWEGIMTAEFDASATTDPDGDPLTFEWDFNDDGVFGDPYVGGTETNPIATFPAGVYSQVCVKVLDGVGGESICCVDVDVTSHQMKDLELRSGVDAYDLALDESDGDLYVLYSDGEVHKYTEADYYDTGALLATTSANGRYLDASPNGDFIVQNDIVAPFYSRSFSAAGAPLSNHTSFSNFTWSLDPTCSTAGPTNNYHGGPYGTSFGPNYIIWWFWQPPTYGGAGGYIITMGSGTSFIHKDYLIGTETDNINGYIWCLEKAPENRVEKRYAYAYFQTGPTYGGFTLPQDIGQDAVGNIFVLDDDSGTPTLRKYTNAGSSAGDFDVSDDLSTVNPLRVEGNVRNFGGSEDLIIVLHGNGTDGYFLSIFDVAIELT